MKGDQEILDLKIHPLTIERWDDLEELFGPHGADGGCWCMYWRLKRSQFDAGRGDSNRKAFKQITASGRPPGLLAYEGKKAVGWMAVAPRDEYPTMDRSRVLKRVDVKKVWSISCFYTAASYRRKGVTFALIEEAKVFVHKQGGTVLEGYPIIPHSDKISCGSAYTGLMSAFLKAGFKEVARYSATRPIMRFELSGNPEESYE
ncbi:MAG: GNAT family N-acetyltransferase [Anaerolineaceae bacterium]|nr:GNAT family N-acetyltransferase [Anaerolineaceae bacterium]MBN2676494.1 GNAT family N-acetyltransferase [Anaerolineaceae bacterium]